MPDRPKKTSKLPRCPECRSPKTVQTFERFGEVVYFCADCEHTWVTRPRVK